VLALYDDIGTTYARTRRTDPRIAAAIRSALGDDVRTVVNVGAGAGSYEFADLDTTAVEPSATMIAQRAADAAPVVQAGAEALPFADGAFDAATAILSDHHWPNRLKGLRELRRVARRAVVLTFDQSCSEEVWLPRDYLPGFRRLPALPFDAIVAALGASAVVPVPVPRDCQDGFMFAFWRRPEAYLDPLVRAGISVFSQLDAAEVEEMTRRLSADLASGAWRARNEAILDQEALDCGYRLLIAE
jgi:SAM-dependent methyltransferase